MSFRAYAERFLTEHPERRPLDSSSVDSRGKTLVAASGKELFALLDEPRKIAEADGAINAVAPHQDSLFYGGDDGKVRKATGDLEGDVVADIGSDSINGFLAYQCRLEYRGGLKHIEEFGYLDGSGRLRTLTDGARNGVLGILNSWPLAACSHEGDIHYSRLSESGSDLVRLFEGWYETVVVETENYIRALCSHQGNLYCGGYDIQKVSSGRKTKTLVKTRPKIHAMASHQGKLYFGGEGGDVRGVDIEAVDLTDESYCELVFTGGDKINALSSVPTYVLQRAGVI